LEKSHQSDAQARRGQVVRPKLDRRNVGRCGWGRKVRRQDFEKKLAIRPVNSYLWEIVGRGSAAGG
jgi:hypothetical protein